MSNVLKVRNKVNFPRMYRFYAEADAFGLCKNCGRPDVGLEKCDRCQAPYDCRQSFIHLPYLPITTAPELSGRPIRSHFGI